MAGQASGGQILTPNKNLTAVAGRGGDKWGANGGDINPIGGGVSGQTGWNKPVGHTCANGETATNYLPDVSSIGLSSVLARESTGALDDHIADASIPAGGSNAG